MVDLFCAVVGDGRIFPVEIDLNKSVGHLKETILEKTPDFAQFGAPALTLYLARRGDTWLKGRDDDMVAVARGEIPDTILALMADEMKPFEELSAEEYFGKDFKPGKGDIHVLVKMPTAKRPRFPTPPDGSALWLSEYAKTFVPSTLLPSIRELAEFVAQPLPVRIGLSHAKLEDLKLAGGDREICDKLFVSDDAAPCKILWQKMFLHAFLGGPVGKTEDSYHSFWDLFIRFPLAALFDRLHGSTERNSHKSASTGTKRPDFLFTFKEVCVFRGEEKAPGCSEDIPMRELSDKLVWSYGKVPYVLGYTAVGYECTLFAIYSTDQKTAKTESFAKFDSAQLSERFGFVLALIQLGRLFPELVRLCPYTAKAEFTDIPRANKVVVHLNPTFVVKDFTNACNVDHTPMSTQQVEALEVKYKQLTQLGVPNMERLIKTSKCGRKFTFEPRGFEVLPKSLRELAVALRYMFDTLVHLHRQGWMHRDIRWPNVLRARDAEPRWFLIDLTDAARSPQQFPDGSHLNKDEHAPEIFVEGGQHTTAVDMWSVGYLIQNSTWNDSWKANEQRRKFLESLLEEDPTKRPSAPQALEKLKKLMRTIPKDEGNQV